MKLVELLAVLTIGLALNSAHATEAEDAGSDTDYAAYCTEQAELTGVEDANEKQNFINECIESFEGSPGGAPQPDQ